MTELKWMLVIWVCCSLAAIALMSGCTQTATTLDPLEIGCKASCTPGGECTAELIGVGETGVDESVLLEAIELGKTGEQE